MKYKILMIKQFFLTLLALFFVFPTQSCSLLNLESQDDCGFVTNSSLQRISLKNKRLKLYIHSSIEEKFHGPLQEAATWWNKALKREILTVIETPPEEINPIAQDGYSVLSLRNNWDPKQPNEQARTSLFWSGDLITEADITFNNKNFNFFTDDDERVGGNNSSSVHMTSLAIHEMGHAIGLDHRPNPENIMYAFLKLGVKRLAIDNATFSSLNCEYGL